MAEVFDLLNKNSGAVVAVATVVYVAVTGALLLEARATRNLRREAVVIAAPRAHPPASFLLELEVTNYGPALAQDVVIEFAFLNASGAQVGDRFRQGEPLVPVGGSRRFLPGTEGSTSMVGELAKQGLSLKVDWSWRDDRRRLGFWSRRHEGTRSFLMVDLERDFYGGWALTEREPPEDIRTIAESLPKIEAALKKIEAAIKSS